MDEQENYEIKILIDALKYTSNIVVDLTNKLTAQEEKINILENKLNKIQKMSMENNLKLKTIDYDKLNILLKSQDKYINVNFNKKKKNIYNDKLENSNDHNYYDNSYDSNNSNNSNNSDDVLEYVIEKDVSNKFNTKNTYNDNSNNKINLQNTEPKDKNKDKIDKLIGSIIKRKNLLNQMINNDKENNIKDCETGLDLTIKTGTVKSGNMKLETIKSGTMKLDTMKSGTMKSEVVDTKSYVNIGGISGISGIGSNENEQDKIEQDKIISAQNNDLNKANNILKQIRRRANIRKM